jgi:23S rRNA (adenine2503-C2)-methyltransferase
MTQISTEADDVLRSDNLARAAAPLEKIALETYVPPAKPSLVGLSRAELIEKLAAIGVAPAQHKMRVQQLWHWIYVRGV